MAICAKFLGYTSSMHPLAIARSTTVLVEPLVTCIIVFYHLIQKFTPIVKDHLDLGEVFCKIKTKSAIKLLVLYPGKLLKIMP